jgi:hypothetical protein
MRIMWHLRSLTSGDSNVVDLRAALDSLPVVPRGEIQMLADESLCQRASQALDSAYFPQPLHSAVYLARYGNRYFATDPNYQRGEWRYLVNLDSTFRVLHAFTW